MELRGEQLSLPDSLALHAARFHITGSEQGNSVFTWKVTAPSSTSEVSLQVPLQLYVNDVSEIQEALVKANVGAQIHGIAHVKSPDELIMPAMHFTVPGSIADRLLRNGSLQLQNEKVQIMASPRWASKPINYISENPRQHFLNSHSGSDRVPAGSKSTMAAKQPQPATPSGRQEGGHVNLEPNSAQVRAGRWGASWHKPAPKTARGSVARVATPPPPPHREASRTPCVTPRQIVTDSGHIKKAAGFF